MLRRIALRQLGLVTVRQAAEHGVDRRSLYRRRDAGLWVPVFSGVLRDAGMRPSASQFTLAGALAVPGSVVAGPSAALVDSMPVGTIGPQPVVLLPRERSGRVAGLTTVAVRAPVPTRPWHTVAITTPPATLALLPRFVDADVVEACLDHCLVRSLTTVAAIRALLERLPTRSVVGRRDLLSLLDERAEGIGHRSKEERKVGRWLDAAGLTGWRRNHSVVIHGDAWECDFVWVEMRVVLEVSPFVTHGSKAQQARDAEKRRALVADGWRVVEAVDVDLADRRAFERCAELLRVLLDVGSDVSCPR